MWEAEEGGREVERGGKGAMHEYTTRLTASLDFPWLFSFVRVL